MYFHYFVIISPWDRAGPSIWTNLNSLHPRMLCVKFGWNWLRGSGEEDFLILSMYFCCSLIISPWKRVGPFIWTNLNPFYPRMLCAKFGWNCPSGSGGEDFLITSIYFRYFVIISPWKRAVPFIWTDLNPLHPRMLCAKFGWNWPSGSEEEDENVKSLQTDGQTDRQTDRRTDRQTTDDRWSEKLTWHFSSGELKRAGPFFLTNVNPLPPRISCAKFGWNWPSSSGEQDVSISSMYFYYFAIISPWKGRGPSFEQT